MNFQKKTKNKGGVILINSQSLIQPNETPKAYRIRLYKNKELYGLTNEDIGKLCNEAFGVEWTESAHRKKTVNYLKGYNDAKKELGTADQQLQNMIEENKRLKRETSKELKKLQTEKLEYNKWLREEARDELITEKIIDAIENLQPLSSPKYIKPIHRNNSYLLCFADCHYSIEFLIKDLFGNIINEYSPEIFEKRMWDLFHQIVEIVEKKHINELSIWELGDGIQGLLRLNSQLMQLRYGVIDSAIHYGHFLSNWLNELSKYARIKFQMVMDSNHNQLRLLGTTKNSFVDENMSKVIMLVVKSELKENPNITIIENPTGLNFGQFSTYQVLGIHGEVKNLSKALDDYSKAYQTPISYIIGAHVHHVISNEVGINQEAISIRSMIGVDPYGMSLPATSDAGASLFEFDQFKGLICEHRLKVD